MYWVVLSFIMFVFSILLYAGYGAAFLEGMPRAISGFSAFSIGFAIIFLLALFSGKSFIVPIDQLVLIIFSALALSYLGNVFFLEGVKYAPNPGLVLAISKSYVILTTIAAAAFFGAAISLKAVIGIGLIIVFSALIYIFSGENKAGNGDRVVWFGFAMDSFFCWAILSLMAKYLFGIGLDPLVFLAYIYLIVGFIYFIEISPKNKLANYWKKNWKLMLAIGFFAAGFDASMYLCISSAPNVGYVNAISLASVSAVTLFSVLLFKDKITIWKTIGILGTTAGLIILVI